MDSAEFVRTAIQRLRQDGATFKQIAARFGVSDATVHCLAKGVYRKDGTHYYPQPSSQVMIAAMEVMGGKLGEMIATQADQSALLDQLHADRDRRAAAIQRFRKSVNDALDQLEKDLMPDVEI